MAGNPVDWLHAGAPCIHPDIHVDLHQLATIVDMAAWRVAAFMA